MAELHDAVQRGDLAAVKSLLASGADPNAASDHSDRPLHIAAKSGDPAVIRALVEAGAGVQFVGELRHSLEDIYLEMIRQEETH